jgi:elongation factor P hydroxylase
MGKKTNENLENARALLHMVEYYCVAYGYWLEPFNGGRHLVITRGKHERVEFWPSTGKVVFNHQFSKPYKVSCIFEFLELINETLKPNRVTLNREYADMVK